MKHLVSFGLVWFVWCRFFLFLLLHFLSFLFSISSFSKFIYFIYTSCAPSKPQHTHSQSLFLSLYLFHSINLYQRTKQTTISFFAVMCTYSMFNTITFLLLHRSTRLFSLNFSFIFIYVCYCYLPFVKAS